MNFVDITVDWKQAFLLTFKITYFQFQHFQVAKSDQAEVDEGQGKGKKWLFAILFSCGVLYVG